MNKEIDLSVYRDKLYGIFSRFDTQKAAFVIMFLLACQPMFGILSFVKTETQLVALFYGKATIVRFLGFLGLTNAAIARFCRYCENGRTPIKTRIKSEPWTFLLRLLLLWSFITMLTAQDPISSFFGKAYRYEGILSYIAYAGLYLSASLIRDEKYRRAIFDTMITISVVLAVLTMAKELSGTTVIFDRSGLNIMYSSSFINPNHYGYYLSITLMLAVGRIINSDSIRKAVIPCAAFAIILVCSVLNNTLGSYVASVFGICLYLILFSVKKKRRKAIILVILLLITLVLPFIITAKTVGNTSIKCSFISLLSSLSDFGDALIKGHDTTHINIGSGRSMLWRATIKMIKDRPVLGFGPDNTEIFICEYLGKDEMNLPHNEYLQIASNMGIPASVLYLSALIWMFIACTSKTKRLKSSAVTSGAVVFTYAVSALFGVSLTVTTCYMFAFLGLTNASLRYFEEE